MPPQITTTFGPHQGPYEFLALIVSGRQTLDVPKSAEIYLQGEPADSVYFIQSGRVKVTVTSEHGKQATVAILEAGQFFGEGCLGNQIYRIATAIALTSCRIARIEKSPMSQALQDQPSFAKAFMDHLLCRNSRIEEDVIDQLFNSSEKRLARLLLRLARYGVEGSLIVPFTMKQEVLAEMIGTTRPRVSSFMNKFREKGFIEYAHDGQILVHVSLLNSVLQDPLINETHDNS